MKESDSFDFYTLGLSIHPERHQPDGPSEPKALSFRCTVFHLNSADTANESDGAGNDTGPPIATQKFEVLFDMRNLTAELEMDGDPWVTFELGSADFVTIYLLY